VNALASGQGPDVFMIPNTSFGRQGSKLVAVPQKQFNVARLRELFPTVVEQDFTYGSDIYALPLYIDTLALFYNRDLFDQAGIVNPPQTWDEFQEMIPKLRSVDQSAGSCARRRARHVEQNVPASADILSLLMLQNGTQMTSDDLRSATFASHGSSGVAAFKFYLQFADSTSPYHAWSSAMPSAVDAFVGGQVAMMPEYREAADTIKKKSPFLRYALAPMPQATGGTAVNYAQYKGLPFRRTSKNIEAAWTFVIDATTQKGVAQAYLTATGRLPALKSLLSDKVNDVNVGVFARQILTARSWYQADDVTIAAALNNAIRSALSGEATPLEALKQAEAQITVLMRPTTE